MDSPSANKSILEKTNHVPLSCPRCGSYNTKFCYYNNYSLSQPRHFCRSCKRYWTKGGTLRNVPVGGGCRRNKLLRRHSSAAVSNQHPNPSFQQRRYLNYVDNSPFQNLWKNPIGADFPISRANNYSARVCPNGPQLGFTTTVGLVAPEPCPNAGGNFRIGSRQIQAAIASSTSLPKSLSIAAGDDNSVIFGSTSFASSTSTMARLLAFGLQQQKTGKEVEMHDPNPKTNPNPYPNPMEQINASSSQHSSRIPWSTAKFAAWIDP